MNQERASEPVIEVAPTGTVFLAGASGVPTASPVWRSTDGVSFSELETPAHAREWAIGAEGDLAVDDQGHVYFVETYLGGLLLTRWSDDGATWEFTIPVVDAASGMYDRPWLVWTEGTLYLYINGLTNVSVAKSTDQGLTWTSQHVFPGSLEDRDYFPGHMSANRDRVVVAGLSPRDGSYVLGAAYSTDGAKTFTERVVADWPSEGGISPYFAGMTAIDEDGIAYVVWGEWDETGCRVLMTSSEDDGKSWSRPRTISPPRGCATFPTIAAQGDHVVAAWYATVASSTSPRTTPGKRATLSSSPWGDLQEQELSYQARVTPRARWHAFARRLTPHASRGVLPVSRQPIHQGALIRELLDFFDVDVEADGTIHVAFSAFTDGVANAYYARSASIRASQRDP